MMFPTARAALGRPAALATSPYVDTRPLGILRAADRTREENSGRLNSPTQFTPTAFHAASTCARSLLPDPYRSEAACSVAALASVNLAFAVNRNTHAR